MIRRIMEEIRQEDAAEVPSVKPTKGVLKEQDLRKVKINKSPINQVPDPKLKNKRFNFEDADFWYLKGYDHYNKSELDSAIDSYRQAVRLNQRHYHAMVNLANCYEQQQCYPKAITWYDFALWVLPESDDAHYGISLCCMKDGDPQRGLHHIEEAIKAIKDKELFSTEEKIHLPYMRAMCLKLLKKY